MQNPDGSVDVNGDGKSNGVFMGSQDIGLYESSIERKREAGNASFQADLGDGFTLTSDYFYSQQRQWNRNVGLQFNSTDWQGATYVPLQSTNTGATALSQYNTPPPDPAWAGSQIYTTQVYEKWPGDVESFSQVETTGSVAQNANLEIDFDNGGNFKGSLRGIRETASQAYIETDLNISDSDGCLWPNQLMPDVSSSEAPPCGTFIYPSQLGGNRVFNPIGIPEDSVPIVANFTGRNTSRSACPHRWPPISPTPTAGRSRQSNPPATTAATPGSPRCASMDTMIFITASTSTSASATASTPPITTRYTLVTPVYAGMGASDPERMPGALCRRRCDPGWRRRRSVHRRQLAGLLPCRPVVGSADAEHRRRRWPATGRNTPTFSARGSTSGRSIPAPWTIPWRSGSRSIPEPTTQEDPGNTWAVWMKETSAYLQTDFGEQLGDMPFSGNVGVRVIHTNLDITQHLDRLAGVIRRQPADVGTPDTQRSYYDVLPALNLALDVTDKLTVRFAASKNMQPLDLSTWGGGLAAELLAAVHHEPQRSQTSAVRSGGGQFERQSEPRPVALHELRRLARVLHQPREHGQRSSCSASTWRASSRTATCRIATCRTRTASCAIVASRSSSRCRAAATASRARSSITARDSRSCRGSCAIREWNSTPRMRQARRDKRIWRGTRFHSRTTPRNRGISSCGSRAGASRSARRTITARSGRWRIRWAASPAWKCTRRRRSTSTRRSQYKIDKYAEIYVNGENLTNEYQRYYLVWPSQEGACELLRAHVHGRSARAVVIGQHDAMRIPVEPCGAAMAVLVALTAARSLALQGRSRLLGWMRRRIHDRDCRWEIQTSCKAQQSGAASPRPALRPRLVSGERPGDGHGGAAAERYIQEVF